jgi:hypothetical protein
LWRLTINKRFDIGIGSKESTLKHYRVSGFVLQSMLSTAPYYAAFSNMPPEAMQKLLDCTIIMDNSKDIIDISAIRSLQFIPVIARSVATKQSSDFVI